MRALLAQLNPFKTREARRLAFLFGVVYFAQGMWYLPEQTITIVLKDRGLSASQVADFTLIAWLPWFVKPIYGLLSDFVPLFGRRRQSYFLLTSAVAGLAGLVLAWGNWIATGQVWTFNLFGLTTFTVVEGFALFFLMALGLAFTDVLTAEVVSQALITIGTCWKDRIFTPLMTLWVFLGQVLSADHSCRAAVARLIAHRASQVLRPCSSEAGA